MRILILNGPKLDRLGERQPEIYGTSTLADLEISCRDKASELGAEVELRQTDSEAQLIAWIHDAEERFDGIVINPAAFTHYSFSVSDALKASPLPAIEVHISNIYAREPWRRRSLVSQEAVGVIAGLGIPGYLFAIEALCGRQADTRQPKGEGVGDGS